MVKCIFNNIIYPILFIFLIQQSYNAQGQILTKSNLPIVVIDTEGREIIDEPKILAHMGIINNGEGLENNINDPFNDWDGDVGIELRGSSSQFLFEKKNYGIELKDVDGTDSSSVILGMGKEEDWVLHGPYSDKSLIRNVLTFHLWEATGRYGSETRLCELMINGDYRGVYVMMEKVKRDGDRVDISRLNENDNEGDDVTGGYIIKIDKFDGTNSGDGFQSVFRPPLWVEDFQVIYYQFDYPKGRDITDSQREYIESFMKAFEETLAGKNFLDPIIGYKSLIDVGSFIDYALLNEITRNVDGYRLSTFLHKDRDSNDRRLKIGPPWDYNLAFGNADYCEGFNTAGWAWDFNNYCNGDFWLIPFWWNRFMQDDEFIAGFKNRWEELREGRFHLDSIMDFINEKSSELRNPQIRNRQRWPEVNQYIWPNAFVGLSYDQDIQYLKDWISDRILWMDREIDKMEVVTALDEEVDISVSLYPNPAVNKIELKAKKEIESIRIFDINGRTVYSNDPQSSTVNIDISDQPSGPYIVRIVIGENNYGKLLIKE